MIVGPTASGKSALAVQLARALNGEIISADSRQIYRGLNIGTGKITKQEMEKVRHHLLDVASPKKIFTAQDFIEKGHAAISEIAARGKLPIIVGGTGFYIDALLGRIRLPNVPPNTKLRARLEKKSVVQLFTLLKRRDPRRAKTIEPHHKRRIIRALEIAHTLGKNPKPQMNTPYDAMWIGIALPMKKLEQNIAARLFARMKGGMVAEAKRLHKSDLSYKRMEGLGLEYRSLARYLQGKITREQIAEELQRDIRRYAKHQIKYWKQNKDIVWIDFKDKVDRKPL